MQTKNGRASVVVQSSQFAQFVGAVFSNNYASLTNGIAGGAISVQTTSIFRCVQCNFDANSGNGDRFKAWRNTQ